jgi:hypothetical protein
MFSNLLELSRIFLNFLEHSQHFILLNEIFQNLPEIRGLFVIICDLLAVFAIYSRFSRFIREFLEVFGNFH